MKFMVAAICLALCIVGAWSRPHHGGRGRPPPPCHIEDAAGNPLPDAVDRPCPDESTCTVGPRDWRMRDGTAVVAFFCTRPKQLHDFTCELTDENDDVISGSQCDVGSECTLGPLEVDHRNDAVKFAYFCDNAVSESCLVESAADNQVLQGKECPRDAECSVGPLGVTFNGQDANAFFCDKPHRRHQEPEDDEAEDDEENEDGSSNRSDRPNGNAPGANERRPRTGDANPGGQAERPSRQQGAGRGRGGRQQRRGPDF